MVRWVRMAALCAVFLAVVGLGVSGALVLVVNDRWIPIDIHPWLHGLLGEADSDVWLPALVAGWLASVVLLAAAVVLSMYYVWKRRQYEALIAGLERELSALRNMPIQHPAPFEDLYELPDPAAAGVLAAAEQHLEA